MSHLGNFYYSRGIAKNDNYPEQLTATNFGDFANKIATDISPSKGQTYICAEMSYGPHDDPKKYAGDGHWRLASHAKKRKFIAFDFDGFSDPKVFDNLREHFAQYS